MRVYLHALQQMEQPSPHAQVPVYCLVRVVGKSLVTVINLPNSGRGWAAKWAASPSEIARSSLSKAVLARKSRRSVLTWGRGALLIERDNLIGHKLLLKNRIHAAFEIITLIITGQQKALGMRLKMHFIFLFLKFLRQKIMMVMTVLVVVMVTLLVPGRRGG